MKMRDLRPALLVGLLVLLAGCKPDGPKSLAKGKELMEKRMYSSAIIEFRNALKSMPKDPEVHYQTGLALLANGDFPGGLLYLRRAAEIDPKHVGSQTKLAELMATSGSNEAVKEAERRARLLSSSSGGAGSDDVIAVLALAELRLGKTEEGTKKLEEVLARSPQAVKAAAVLAQVKLSKGDAKGAEELLVKTAQAAPKSWEGWLTLARFYEMQRRLPEAEKTIAKVLELDPNNEMALTDLGTIQVADKRMPEAEATFRRLSDHPSKRYRGMHAIFLYQTGKRAEAIKELEELQRANFNDATLRSQLMAAYVQMGDLEKAEKMLGEVVRKSPKDLEALLQHGTLLAQLNRVDDLESNINKALELKPNSAEAHYLMSRVYRARRNQANQERELREALKHQPSFSAARVELSQVMLATNRANEALELLSAEKEPGQKGESLAMIIQKNWIYFSQNQIDKVREGIKAGYQQGRAADLLLQDGLLALREKRYGPGRELLKEALAQRPAELRILGALAESYVLEDRSNVKTAVAIVEQHVAKYPKNAELQQFLGNWLLASGRPAEAKAAYEAALAIQPASKAIAFGLVRIDLGTGNFAAANKALDDMLAKDPKDPGAHMLKAMVLEQTGESPKATDSYRKVLASEPNNALALNNLAYKLSLDPKNMDEALQMAQRAKDASPENPAIADTLGWIHYKKGMYWSSVRLLETATKTPQTATPVRLFHLAMAYQKAGNAGKASETYRRGLQVAQAAQMKGMPPEAAEAKKVLGI